MDQTNDADAETMGTTHATDAMRQLASIARVRVLLYHMLVHSIGGTRAAQ